MAKRLLAIVILLMMGDVPLNAQDVRSGNYWHKICSGADHMECLAYLAGLNAMHDLKGGAKFYCVPDNVTLNQAKAVSLKYLNDNPQERHLAFEVLVVKALQRAFPCLR